jgi:hypothetical protein
MKTTKSNMHSRKSINQEYKELFEENKMLKESLVFTADLPTKTGYYWWTNFGEHTPVVLRVQMDYSTKKLWAGNEEFTFIIEPKPTLVQSEMFDEEPLNDRDGYNYGDEMWCYIPCPMLPNGKQPTPDCY